MRKFKKAFAAVISSVITVISAASVFTNADTDSIAELSYIKPYASEETATMRSDQDYSFDDIRKMTADEVKELYSEKGLTEEKGYTVWTSEKMADYFKANFNGGNKTVLSILVKTGSDFTTSDGKVVVNEAYSTDQERLHELLLNQDGVEEQMEAVKRQLELPEDLFWVMSSHCSIRVEMDENGESVNRRYICYFISPVQSEHESAYGLMASALNYLQLNPDFDSIWHESPAIGTSEITTTTSSTNVSTVTTETTSSAVPKTTIMCDTNEVVYTVVSYPSKTVYNAGEELDLSGIAVKCRSETYWHTEDNCDRGVIYGEPYIVDGITLDPKDAWITELKEHEDGAIGTHSCKGDRFNSLVPGKYMVAYGESYQYGDKEIKFCDFMYEVTIEPSALKGDANGDGSVDMADAVLIMQALANPDKYGENGTAQKHLTEQGRVNADIDGDGLTVGDAYMIQIKLLGFKDAPESVDASAVLGLKGGDIAGIHVKSSPKGYDYSFTGDKAQEIVDYLSSLNLIVNFPENPEDYDGMTWIITVIYDNKETLNIYHDGMFISTLNGTWYKMSYEEASRFDHIIWSYSNTDN